MSNWSAQLWARLLSAYGKIPYHPGKWRVLTSLQDRAAPAWITPRVVRRRGVWYQLDLKDYLPRWVFLNAFEVWETRLVERLARPGWAAIDVGANIGYYTLLLARLAGPRGRVYAFEPTERSFESLVRNIALNRFNNVQVFRSAVGDSCRLVSLVCADQHHPSKTSVTTSSEPVGATVPMITLDQFVEEQGLTRLDFLKADIEGAEGLFLAGAVTTLSRFRPVLMIELNRTALAEFGTTPEHVVKQLCAQGYRLFRITWHGLVELRGVPRPGEYWNVFAFAE